jgi:flagellar hook-associated protein FlgK
VGVIEALEAKLARAGASDGVVARQLRDARDDYVATLRSLIEADLDESDTEEFS